MRILQTATDAINVERIDRIAYLNREERIFLTETTGRPDYATPEQGEVIVDIGRAVPVTLVYVEDQLEGSLIVARLTDLIANSDSSVIKFAEVRKDARDRVAEMRYRDSDGGEDTRDVDSTD